MINISEGRDSISGKSRADRGGEPHHQSPAAQINPRSTARQTMSQEFEPAVAVAERGREALSRLFLQVRLGNEIRASSVEPVIEEIFASIQRHPHTFNGLMRCRRGGEGIYSHALATCALMISLARHMKLAGTDIREAGMAGLLLNIGMAALPVGLDPIGGSQRRIPPEVTREHVLVGYNQLASSDGIPESVCIATLQHHERYDGSGYFRALKGKEASFLARMAAICDTYDTLTSDGPDSCGTDPAVAIAQISAMVGKFDPEFLISFIEIMGIHPVGSIVELRSGRLAMVIDQDPLDHSRPRVLSFWSIIQGGPVEPVLLALSECSGEEAIVGAGNPEAHGIEDWPHLRERLFAMGAKAIN